MWAWQIVANLVGEVVDYDGTFAYSAYVRFSRWLCLFRVTARVAPPVLLSLSPRIQKDECYDLNVLQGVVTGLILS